MSNYTDVFSNDLVPPAGMGYQALSINGATNPSFWPYNYTGTGIVISKIIDATPGSGGTLQLPDATQVSVGEDTLIFNVGSNTLTVQSYTGSAVTTIAAGTAKYIYLKTNTTTAGTWGVVTYGTGTSSADAAALAGYGLSALGGATLNTAFTSTDKSALFTLDNTYRAKLVNATSGTWTLTLQAAATATSTFFFLIRNSGSGIITIDPDGTETIDGATTKDIRSGESAIIICNGTGWYSVGYGRAVQGYTLLSQSVTAGGTIALTAAQALNQLINFTGSPAAAVTVTVPNNVGIWYLTNSSTQTVTFKGVTGTSLSVPAGVSMVAKCDGTNMVDAFQEVGSTAVPAVNFLRNPLFRVWQRGTSFTGAATTPLADGWFTGVSTDTARTFSQVTSGQIYTQYGLRAQRNAASSGLETLEVRSVLETSAAKLLAGRTVTFSVYVRTGANLSATNTLGMVVWFGTGINEGRAINSWTGLTSASTFYSDYAANSDWTRLSYTTTVPATCTELGVSVYYNPSGTAGAADYFDITGAQLEIGSAASVLRGLAVEAELSECQRFYEKSFAVSTTPAQNVGTATGETRFNQVVGASTAQGAFSINYKTRKRAGSTPTITLYNPAAANAQIRNITGSTDWSASSATSPSETGFFLSGTSPAGSSAGSGAAIHWTADYEL